MITDVSTILAFIKAGAAATNSLDHVVATEDSLRQGLTFAPSPGSASQTTPQNNQPGYAKTMLLVAPEGDIAGMAVYYYTFSTWRAEPGVILEELYVRPEFRRRGYARQLIRELAKEVKRINGGKLAWVCLPDNARALRLYDGLGATRVEDWLTLRLSGDALDQLLDEEK